MSITTVAKRAGVSSSTVSRVINNHPRVAPETARTVRKVMAELGYVPSDRRPGPKPRSRSSQIGRSVAFLKLSTQKANSPGFEDLLRGVSEAARRLGLTLSLYDLPHADEIPRKIVEHPMIGVLVHGARPTERVHRALRSLPCVWLMGNRVRPEWGDQVMPDVAEVGRLAALYLISRMHKQVACINLDPGHWPFRNYLQSFALTAEEHQAHVARLVAPGAGPGDARGQFSPEAIGAVVESFLALSPRPTGLFVADDYQAAIIQPALMHRGVKFGPGGVDMISCNKEEPYIMGLTPRPATIDIRVESIGHKGLEHLLWRSSHPGFPDRVITMIEPRLIGPDSKPMTLQSEAEGR